MPDKVTPDYQASIDFLRRWRPEGPWVLTAVAPDKKWIRTATLASNKDLLEWLSEYGTDKNVYFSVNPTIGPVESKAGREDIAALDWVHVDVDPRPNLEAKTPDAMQKHLVEEQERILGLFTTNLPQGVPPPTVTWFSGGGYWAAWRLKDPFEINGQEERYEEAARYNMQLELVFGADSCHNVDRIARLPGTVNWPDAGKIKKGRVPALAELVEFNDHVYDLSVFTKAPKRQPAGDSGLADGATEATSVSVSGNVRRIKELSELEGVSDRAKVVIVQGHDPESPLQGEDQSRSAWLFYACNEMVRGGCDDDTIYAVITDPDWKISESVIGKGTSMDRYAKRQIERAKENAVDPILMEFNGNHAVIGDIGGKCRIISDLPDPNMNGRARISFQTQSDFMLRYCNRKVKVTTPDGDEAWMDAGKWWIYHPYRRQYRTIIFAPSREVPDAYNLWRGFSYDALPGRSCDLFLAHVHDNVCGRDEAVYRYLMGWMASAVQKPANPGYAAIVLRGRQGVGKSFFVKAFGQLFGRHFLQVSDPRHVVGSFNAHLEDCLILFAEEALYAGDKKHESTLKALVTEEMLTIERKGVDIVSCPNYVHLLMASNEQWVVPANFDERRFLVLDVGDEQMGVKAYFRAIQEELNAGGYEKLLHTLMTWDLSGFDVRTVPNTEALKEQKVLNYMPEEEWWYSKLQDGEVFEGKGWPDYVFTAHLTFDFITYAQAWRSTARSNNTRLGQFMNQATPSEWNLRSRASGKHEVLCEDGESRSISRPRIYLLPSLQVCREIWDSRFGGPHKWEQTEDTNIDDVQPF